MMKKTLLFTLLLLALLCLAACAAPKSAVPALAPAATAAPRVTPSPTAVPTPTATPAPTPYTFVWLADTQALASTYPEIYECVIQHVADQREAKNIVCLLHTGDLINNAYTDHDGLNAQKAFALLPDDLQVFTAMGNHDQVTVYERFTGKPSQSYAPYLNIRFDNNILPEAEFMDGISHYALFSAGGTDYLLLSIGYGVHRESVPFAQAAIEAYPDRTVILVTHHYMKLNGTRPRTGTEIFDSLVKPYPNVKIVLCGHLRGAARNAVSLDDDGDGQPDRTVHELMYNYQEEGKGGMGYLRYLTVDPLTGDIAVSTYSPWLDDYNLTESKGAHADEFLLEAAIPAVS